MVAFAGTEVPAKVAEALGRDAFAGVTLFRDHNVESLAQVRALTGALQRAARTESRPLLIAADQEGGQLNALGDGPTEFAGAMALGAAGDPALAERVGRATAIELRALGVNVNYAPVCDLATAPDNPALGIRSFGDSPAAAGDLAAAYVRGLQAGGRGRHGQALSRASARRRPIHTTAWPSYRLLPKRSARASWCPFGMRSQPGQSSSWPAISVCRR